MSDKKPTPFTLTICTTGVNHTMQYRSSAAATSAYTDLACAVAKARATERDSDVDMHEVVDDCGSRATVDPVEVHSYRLADVMEEHRANMRLKIAEMYAAVEFEETVRNEHPALLLMKARSPGLITGAR